MRAFRGPDSEPVRALTLFGLLLFVLVAIAVELAMEEFSLTVLTERLETGRSEAQRIAALVEQVGWEGNGINFGRVRQNRNALQNFIGRRNMSPRTGIE